MFNVILPRILWILGLILAQTLVFNHIHLVLGFALGLVVDTLSNTVGAAAGALTLVGLVTPLLLRAFAPDDKLEEEFTPSIRTMQWSGFLKFAIAVTFIHTMVFFLLETFSLFDPLRLLIEVVSSTALTVIFMATFEKLRNTSRSA